MSLRKAIKEQNAEIMLEDGPFLTKDIALSFLGVVTGVRVRLLKGLKEEIEGLRVTEVAGINDERAVYNRALEEVLLILERGEELLNRSV